ncbi:tigger transposable element-derived protein 1-like [Bradysia coprophila]|uniref:tigger transposable element-derived protein 1-like n=1 Tax=Bradysia coprophila TaxID=38358 RepID=UPI00187D7C09|nr:tigger transposable element-derived protein 1-like [Bradysia coprophila]
MRYPKYAFFLQCDNNFSPVRGIGKFEDKIRTSVSAGATISLSKTSHARNPLFEKMERLLNIWIEDKNQKNMPLNGECIRMKAKRIYDHISQFSVAIPEFSASKGWLDNFKKRFALHNICLTGEAASADEESGYNDHQIFNADETGLFWKKMPKRTYVAKTEKRAPGFKVAKDRLSLLFCSNKSGDLMTKPLAIHKSLNPRAFKNADKQKFPVFWRANKKAWMTAALFREWFTDMFVPEVKQYLKKKNLSFKVLLLIDNATCHLEDLSHPNVKVVFLPANTTSIIQPMDQGIIATFKALMLLYTFEWLLGELDSDSNNTVSEIWKKYTMVDCLDFIRRSLQSIQKETLAGCWKNICPVKTIEIEIVDEQRDLSQIMTTSAIKNILELSDQLRKCALDCDDNLERSAKFERELSNIMALYHELKKTFDRLNEQLIHVDEHFFDHLLTTTDDHDEEVESSSSKQ